MKNKSHVFLAALIALTASACGSASSPGPSKKTSSGLGPGLSCAKSRWESDRERIESQPWTEMAVEMSQIARDCKIGEEELLQVVKGTQQ